MPDISAACDLAVMPTGIAVTAYAVVVILVVWRLVIRERVAMTFGATAAGLSLAPALAGTLCGHPTRSVRALIFVLSVATTLAVAAWARPKLLPSMRKKYAKFQWLGLSALLGVGVVQLLPLPREPWVMVLPVAVTLVVFSTTPFFWTWPLPLRVGERRLPVGLVLVLLLSPGLVALAV